MKFWIRINGLQEGPMEIDQMTQYNITPTTYVWCAGMKDWAYAKDVEDLKEVLAQCAAQNTTIVDKPNVAEEPATAPIVDSQDNKVDDNETIESIAEEAAPEEVVQETIVEEETVVEEVHIDTPTTIVAEPQHTAPIAPAATIASEEVPPCPPTNLVWSIITTVLCCQVLGIIAIVFSAQVSRKYNMGDYDKAKKYSEVSAWLIIANVVVSILWASLVLPFILIG